MKTQITKEEFNEIIRSMWLSDDHYRVEIIAELNRCFDKYLESKCNIGVLMVRFECKTCGNRGLQEERPDNTECGGCNNPDWKIMKNQESYIIGGKDWVHPHGEI